MFNHQIVFHIYGFNHLTDPTPCAMNKDLPSPRCADMHTIVSRRSAGNGRNEAPLLKAEVIGCVGIDFIQNSPSFTCTVGWWLAICSSILLNTAALFPSLHIALGPGVIPFAIGRLKTKGLALVIGIPTRL